MDNKITDKGWTAMRNMLDREMPTNRRRRFAWWWFGLLLLPIAVYGSWKWLSLPMPASKPIETISGSNTIANLQTTQATNTPQQPELQASLQETTKPETASTAKPVSASTLSTNTNKPQSKTSLKASPAAIAKSGIQDSPTLPQEIAGNQAMPLAPTRNSDIAIQCLKTPIQALDFQGNKSITLHSKTVPIQPVITMGTSNKPWAIGATTLVSTEQFNFINGFSTGLTVDWKFAKKWGLRTGLMYNIHTPEEKHRPIASVLSDEYTSKVDGNVLVLDLITGDPVSSPTGFNAYTDSLGGNVLIPISRLQRLELPVTVFYQAARPLKIIAGLSLARNISTKADRQNYSGDYILRLTDQVAEDDASELSSGELGRWSADATLGLGLTLGKKFELGIATKIPLNNTKSLKKTTEALNAGNLSDEVQGRTNRLNTPLLSLYGTLFF